MIGLIADQVWRARGRMRSDRRPADLNAPLDHLAGIGRGDREATRYGLTLADAQSDDRDA